jgi:hypothetical protein
MSGEVAGEITGGLAGGGAAGASEKGGAAGSASARRAGAQINRTPVTACRTSHFMAREVDEDTDATP